MLSPKLVAGGGAVEMLVSQALSTNKEFPDNSPYKAVAQALG